MIELTSIYIMRDCLKEIDPAVTLEHFDFEQVEKSQRNGINNFISVTPLTSTQRSCFS